MEDEAQRERAPLPRWQQRVQRVLGLDRIGLVGQPEAAAEPAEQKKP